MSTLLIYAHLLVIFLTSVAFFQTEKKPIQVFGAVNIIWVTIFAYIYAMWQLWQTFAK